MNQILDKLKKKDVKTMKQTITDPNEVNWVQFWQKALEQKKDKTRTGTKQLLTSIKKLKKMIIMIYYFQSLF